jgi:diguanylate cyclase (GGDEF)-like protein/PAS domain S-box-containing protein
MLTKIRVASQAAVFNDELLGGRSDFHVVADAIAVAIFVSRGDHLHYVNHAAESITGYSRRQLLSMNFSDLIHPDSRDLFLNRQSAWQPGMAQHEVKILAKSGEARWLEITTATIEFEGALSSLVSAYDVTPHKETEQQLQLLSVTDSLTGLGNYRRLVEAVDAETQRSERTGRPFAVLLLDLDQLKKINDRYGHMIGSQALCRVADALRVHFRIIDSASRYGGDEFAVVLPETAAGAARLAASRIHSRIALDIRQPQLSVSTGVAVYPQDGKTTEALLRAADHEVYRMKSQKNKSAPLELAGAANSLNAGGSLKSEN